MRWKKLEIFRMAPDRVLLTSIRNSRSKRYRHIRQVYQHLSTQFDPSNLILAYESLLINGDFQSTLLTDNSSTSSDRRDDRAVPALNLPIWYTTEGTDLLFVLEQLDLTKKKLISLHSKKLYQVSALGFLPGFAYLGDLSKKLNLSRKALPVSIKEGSLGIAGRQTAIYPSASPGGWQIIGKCPIPLFTPDQKESFLIQPHSSIKFTPINKKQFLNLKRDPRLWKLS